MINLLLFLLLGCLILLIIGIIKPQVALAYANDEKINRKNVFKYYGIGLLVLFALYATTSKVQKVLVDRVVYDTAITYSQLAKTPNDFSGKKVEFSGKVIDILEAKQEVDLQIAVNGNKDDIILVVYTTNGLAAAVSKDNNVTIKGEFRRIHTYKSASGVNISAPLIYGDKITIN